MADQKPDPTPFIEQANRILDEAGRRKLTLRLIGALAFHIHCPKFNYIQLETGRFFTDVDFMAYVEEQGETERMFKEWGYLDDPRIKTVPGLRRSIFFTADDRPQSDGVYDVLKLE